MNVKIEKRIINSKSFGMFVNNILIGTSPAQFDVDHAIVMLKKALGLESNRETWRVIFIPHATITGSLESRTNYTFDTMEDAHSWIRRNPTNLGLYRAEKD